MPNTKYLIIACIVILVIVLTRWIILHFKNSKRSYGTTNQSIEMMNVEQILNDCEAHLPKKTSVEGLLLLSVETDGSGIKTWEAIIQTTKKSVEKYYRVNYSKENKDIVVSEAEILFGYRPFGAAKVGLKEAQTVASQEIKDSTCHSYRLYFPLSPMDTEPIWQLTFENDSLISVGAETGMLI